MGGAWPVKLLMRASVRRAVIYRFIAFQIVPGSPGARTSGRSGLLAGQSMPQAPRALGVPTLHSRGLPLSPCTGCRCARYAAGRLGQGACGDSQ